MTHQQPTETPYGHYGCVNPAAYPTEAYNFHSEQISFTHLASFLFTSISIISSFQISYPSRTFTTISVLPPSNSKQIQTFYKLKNWVFLQIIHLFIIHSHIFFNPSQSSESCNCRRIWANRNILQKSNTAFLAYHLFLEIPNFYFLSALSFFSLLCVPPCPNTAIK